MKKTFHLFLLLATSLFSFASYAQVTPFVTNDMAFVENDARSLSQTYSGDKVLIAYDIDNTLLAPTDHGDPTKNNDLMTTQWWDWQSNLIATHSSSPFRVAKDINELIKLNDLLLPLMDLTKVDPHVDQDIQDEQKLQNKVIALSSRDPALFSASENQLTNNNIDLSISAMGGENGIAGRITPPTFIRPVIYSRGIALTGGQDKGLMLHFLLDQYQKQQPISAIIFVDDTQANIDKMTQAFQSSPIDVHTFLYTKEKTRVDQFNADDKTHVNAQWVALKSTLKDTFGWDLSLV